VAFSLAIYLKKKRKKKEECLKRAKLDPFTTAVNASKTDGENVLEICQTLFSQMAMLLKVNLAQNIMVCRKGIFFLHKSAKNPNLHPRNFQIMPMREIKFPFSLLKNILYFKTIRSIVNGDSMGIYIFTVLEDDMKLSSHEI